VEIWKLKANEFIHELEDLFSRWWNAGCLRTLVEGVQDNVCRLLCIEEGEHFFEAFYHDTIARLLFSSIVHRIESGEYVATRIGPSRKLSEERGKQIVKFLFADVLEVKIKIGHRGHSSIVQRHDILYD
jgi:hypothetical protein